MNTENEKTSSQQKSEISKLRLQIKLLQLELKEKLQKVRDEE